MNPASAHRFFNEAPIIIMGLTTITFALGWARDSRFLKRLAYIGFAISAVYSVLLISSGEAAVSALPPQAAASAMFSLHRNAAVAAIAFTMACLLLGVSVDILEDKARFVRLALPALLALSVITLALMLVTLIAGKVMLAP